MRKTFVLFILCLCLITLWVQFLFLDVRIELVPYIQYNSRKQHRIIEEYSLEKELVIINNYVTKVDLLKVTLDPVRNGVTKFISKMKRTNEKLIDLDNFTYIINSPVCENGEELPVIIVISSAPDNFQKRQAIRNTWGKPTDYLKHVFLLGKTRENLHERILGEHKQYGDIVQGNFIDAYKNLTYKHVMGLKWASQYCPNAKFILKTDDDVFVHLYGLKELLGKRLLREKDLISCLINKKLRVLRNVSSKWYVSKKEFARDFFPIYCSGSVIVYSPEVVERLVTASENERYFFIDDVYITGILREKLNINLTEIRDLFLNQTTADTILKKGEQLYGKFLFGPWNANVSEIMKLWNVTEEYRKLQESIE